MTPYLELPTNHEMRGYPTRNSCLSRPPKQAQLGKLQWQLVCRSAESKLLLKVMIKDGFGCQDRNLTEGALGFRVEQSVAEGCSAERLR